MAEKQYFVTEEGLASLEQELEYLKTVRRKEVAEKIKVALSFGDLSENSEYDEAKNEQGKVEVTSAAGAKSNRNFKIVGSNEADPRGGKISDESAVGKALIGARVGQTVEVETPVGVSVYHILSISR